MRVCGLRVKLPNCRTMSLGFKSLRFLEFCGFFWDLRCFCYDVGVLGFGSGFKGEVIKFQNQVVRV